MTYEYTVHLDAGGTRGKDDKGRHVLVEPLPLDRYRVVIDGVESLVSARKVESAGASATWSLVDVPAGAAEGVAAGAQRVVDVDAVDGAAADFKVTVGGGEPLLVQVHDLRDHRAAGDDAAGGGMAGELRAAMPGKVVKLLCKPGESVKPGQALLVIEAMKMENELRSPSAGKVTEIAAREGQTVEAGQLLVALTPA